MRPEFFARVHVRHMYFDERTGQDRERVAQSAAVVGPGASPGGVIGATQLLSALLLDAMFQCAQLPGQSLVGGQ